MLLIRLSKSVATTISVERILFYGFVVRLIGLIQSIIYDNYIEHIKYTDIDYQVFTNGSRAIYAGKSPYNESSEFRYSPIIALIFLPNIMININFGKLILIICDIICGNLLYLLNIHQGTHRMKAKLFLILWLFNPITFAISTRGSFEPVILLIVLSTIVLLTTNNYILAGLLYGLSIHVKLYPLIYGLTLYIYMINRKPYLITQTKISYWLNTLRPGLIQCKFFISTLITLLLSSYLSYKCFGYIYLEQSFLYHLRRKDLAHNFSVYFYLFRLYPNYSDLLSKLAFLTQAISILILSIQFCSFELNRRIKLRKLTFSLFITTFIFVTLNKVCTSQYFNWYLIFLPLILDSSKLSCRKLTILTILWFLSQATWLLIAYLYEYQHYKNLVNYLGLSSFVFFLTNIYISISLCRNFDVNKQETEKGF